MADARKAAAVKACLDGPVSPEAPASILQTHNNATVYLDRDSASLLPTERRGAILTNLSRQSTAGATADLSGQSTGGAKADVS